MIKLILDRTMRHQTLSTNLLMVAGAFLGYALTLSKKSPPPSIRRLYEATKSNSVLPGVNG